MFVAEGAKEKLLTQRKEQFLDQYLLPMIQEAKKLGISEEDISNMINQLKGSE